MKICDTVYQLKVEFNVTPQVKRYVYVYIIEGKEGYYLIDAGVKGCQKKIGEYIHKIGNSRQTINALILTHSHPDHIGAARSIKEGYDSCIYACQGEKDWIEDTGLQYKERPIPNFHELVEGPVMVDRIIKDKDILYLEPGIELEVINSSGHSRESLSFYYPQKQVLFTGDAIPVIDDVPISENSESCIRTLKRLGSQGQVVLYCPAWDKVYDKEEGLQNIQAAISQMERIRNAAEQYADSLCAGKIQDRDVVYLMCRELKMQQWEEHPLFKRSILKDIYRLKEERKK